MSFNPLPILLTAVGIYFLVRLRFFFIVHPVRTLRKMANAIRSHNAFSSLMLALAGTLGVGNIFGVCIGIIVGGVGSIFWLFISCVFSSVIKYCEVLLTHDHIFSCSEGNRGGMSYVIRNSFSGRLSIFWKIYAALCILLSLIMGAALQCGTVVESVTDLASVPPIFVSATISTLVVVALIGGSSLIKKITTFVIPMSTIIYIILTLMIILKNLSSVPDMILLIISDAFRIESGLGGIIGFLGCKAIREGYSRGILSNEAGSGTSGIAHADSGILNPANAALMGIAEVVFDTGFMCMLTAWAVILSVPNPTDFTGGMSLILTAFSTSLSPTASYMLVFLTFIYAYSTVICWYHYGVESIYALFGRESKYIYLLIFTFACVALSVIGNRPLIYLTDIVILLMSVITLLTLIKNSDRIVFLSEKGGILNRRIKENGFLKELKFHSRK